jgi:hypothetical protein
MKRSIFYFAILGLLLFFFNADAQDVAIGIRGGISIPNLSAGGSEQNPLNTGYSSRQGPDAGLYAEFKFSDLFSLQPMVQYSSQGGKKDGLQAFPTPDQIKAEYQEEGQTAPTYLYANFKSDAKLNYLMIPVLAKFGWNFHNSPLRIYVDAGPFVGFLLSAKQVTSGTSNFYLDNKGTEPLPGGAHSLDSTQNIKSQLNTTNFGIEGNLGLQYKLKRSYAFIEGGGNYGFLNIQKGTANGKNNTGAATVDIGYALWLGKK